ncbi:MAG: histidinol dehydrogenase [Candidatus Schekmanbacteria bacterium GWA2_38_11]|uniref:Histidinol dehydrogenase n=1 Tax=Candidatus Schekmanbacteria bacterium GWA2_38_11 TaxID=1817876 RepID=A0A1F7RHL9_9BACT|nr:MAG: histidinol dehydrogenase [Candidatus Schekmanbacteria bacterium GWA2_38_11]
MKIIRSQDREFKNFSSLLLDRSRQKSAEVEKKVREIIDKVKRSGDKALMKFSRDFDGVSFNPAEFRVREEEFLLAEKAVPEQVKRDMKAAMERIKKFQLKSLKGSWIYSEKKGILLGQAVKPINTVGIYVPGGKASYPSSVFMNAIPAKIAGVRKIIMCSPAPQGRLNPYCLVAAKLSEVDEVYKVGGAQAIAAMAYGTDTIPRVDKIVGPGNIFVATAKKMVFGEVGIDMVAGPTEVVVLADSGANPKFIAADMLSQAEHDETASAILVTDSEKIASQTSREISRQVLKLKRSEIARKSLGKYGAIILTETIDQAADIVNQIAPEHLEIMARNPMRFVSKIENAGAIFLGSYSPEALGDYAAGPSHVLPTGGTARFSSALSADDFIKKISLISYDKNQFLKVKKLLETMAKIEGLDGHFESVRLRR